MNRPHRNVRPSRPTVVAAAILVVLCLVNPGCGREGPEMAPVSGTVKYNGKPVTKGTISFASTDPARQNSSSPIGPDGSYQLQTRDPGDGAEPGEYTVTVFGVANTEVLDYIPKGKPPARKSELPAKYENPSTSDIKVTVKSGSNTIPIELKD